MQRVIETIFSIIIILIVALIGTAIGYYSAGYAPKREAIVEARKETTGIQAKAEPFGPPPAEKEKAALLEPFRQAFNPPQKEMLALAAPPMQPAIPAQTQIAALAPKQSSQVDERGEAVRHEQKVQTRYSSCVKQAELTFTQTWDEKCKSAQEERRKNYQQCISTHGLSKATCSRTYAAVPERNCKLPSKVIDKLGSQLQTTAHRCLLELQARLE